MNTSKANTQPAARGRKAPVAGSSPGEVPLTERGSSKQDLVLSMLHRSEGTT